MADGLLLGVDVGTSSTKGVLVDRSGRIVARAQREHGVASPRPGWFEHDAESVWWRDFADVTRELVAGTERPVEAVAVSGIGPCLLPAGDRGPLRPAILYGVDTRAHEEIRLLDERLGRDEILRRAGSPLTSQAVGPKMLWLRTHEPDVWARTRRFFMAGSFLVHRLTGAYVLDHHSASQCTPMYDIEARTWNADWCELVAPGLALPELHWSDEIVGTVTAPAAELTGLRTGTPVLTGTIDAWAEAESVGVRSRGDVMVMYGTTMFLVGLTDRVRPTAQLWGTVGVRPDSTCTAAGMATSGAVTTWFRDLVGGDYGTLSAQAATVPAGSDGLLLLPYFAGERTPLFDEHARGLVIGLTLHHGRGHLYRAVLEGVAYGVRHNLDAMAANGLTAGPGRREAAASALAVGPSRLVAVGGGTAGDVWTQIVSDVTGLPQDVTAERVGACYGDTMLAAQALGIADATTTAAWNPVVSRIEPHAERHAVYDGLFPLYLDAYRNNAATMHHLATR